MRWENLSATSATDQAAPATPPLPLALPGATVRTFDTPGFAGMTFYEVQAKSIINRVPDRSRVPFEWTINPYRGCSHACSYCLAGDTPILLADGRTRPLAEIRVGDAVYGTVRSGRRRRFAVTRVLDHWSTVKPAFRVTLDDGRELVASGDHRFLTDRGWRSVANAPPRSCLGPGSRLVGTAPFSPPPPHTADYRRGYLCGVFRGGARLTSHRYVRQTGGHAHVHRFPTVVGETRARAEAYLCGLGISTARADLVAWPRTPSSAWRRGFLAGLFDEAGTDDGGGVSVPEPVRPVVEEALRDLGIEYRGAHGGLRLAGGPDARLRFRQATDPAVSRKHSVDGDHIGSAGRPRVAAIEPLGLELSLFDITTGTGDFIANGVVSHNCFARNTHTYLDLDAGHDFDTKVIVKVNAGTVLRRELARPRWQGGHIAMGTNVDCYQRAEGRYRLMPEIISALRDFANPFSILTKGTLILRDLPLLRSAAEVTRVGISFSVGFVDETVWRDVESGTPSPRRRLDAVRALTDAGFRVGVLMAPILPGLTDTDESIDATVAAIAASGATSLTPLALHLRPGSREWYGRWLARAYPALVPHYRRLYAKGAYLPSAYQKELSARVRVAMRRHGMVVRESRGATRQIDPPEEGDVQLSLL